MPDAGLMGRGGGSSKRAWSRLRLAAVLSLGIHLTAGLAMVFILRHGLDTNLDIVSRLRFLSDRTGLWVGGWVTWNAAALSILVFYTAFVRAHQREGMGGLSPLRVALWLGAAGVVGDLTAEWIEMVVLPSLADRALQETAGGATPPAVGPFLAAHRTAVLLTGYMANGLYTIAAMLLAWRTRREYPAWVWLAGLVGVGVSGLGLSAAVLAGSVWGMVMANVFLVPSICIWQIGVAVTAHRLSLDAGG